MGRGMVSVLITELNEWKRYRERKCAICGKKIPEGSGYESVASFNLLCDRCFRKQSEQIESFND